eukprot:Partr_v1_DN27733_c1_g1_i2_m67322 putative ankyrin repeat protein
MTKFGKYIQTHAIPEWSSQYINYKSLKKIISAAEKGETSPSLSATPASPLVAGDFAAVKRHFFTRLDVEVDKVNAFYLQKEQELQSRLRSLSDKKNIMVKRKGRRYGNITVSSLKSAVSLFQADLDRFQKFMEINDNALCKILKKWDKRSKSQTKEAYLATCSNEHVCFNSNKLSAMADDLSLVNSELTSLNRDDSVDDVAVVNEDGDVLEMQLARLLIVGDDERIENFVHLNRCDLDDLFVSRVFWLLCGTAEAVVGTVARLEKVGSVDFTFIDSLNDRSYIHQAAESGNLGMLRFCVETGKVDLNLVDSFGRRALHYCALKNHLHCLTYLISKLNTADLDAVDNEGFTALLFAVSKGYEECARVLVDSGASVTEPCSALCVAVDRGFLSMCKLLKLNTVESVASPAGLFPVHIACQNGFHEILEFLLSENPEAIEKKEFYRNEWKPLFYAVSEGNFMCVKVLIARGCNLNIVDDLGWSPIAHAVWRGHQVIYDILVSNMPAKKFPVSSSSGVGTLAELPALSLPPPTLPMYGQKYIGQNFQLQITIGHGLDLIDNQVTRVRIIMNQKSLRSKGLSTGTISTTYSTDKKARMEYKFICDDLDDCIIDFDFYHALGSRVLGRASLLPQSFE